MIGDELRKPLEYVDDLVSRTQVSCIMMKNKLQKKCNSRAAMDFFCVLRGRNVFFPILKKNPYLLFFFIFFLKIGIFMVTFSFNLIAIVCVIANLFLLTKNDIIVHYYKFPN